METFLEMQEELTSQLLAAASSTFFTTDKKKKLIVDAYIWATELYAWPELQKGRDTNSQADHEYYDYPDDFRTNTLGEYLYFDGKPYRRKMWNDYLEYKRLYPNSQKRIFADYGRQYFIFPTPVSVAQITVWGQIQATKPVEDTDKTIFSLHSSSGNEAVIRKALSVAVKRVDATLSANEEKSAIAQLSVLWNKVQGRQQTAQPINRPMFRIPDFFAGRGSTFTPGNFGVTMEDDDE